MRSVIDLTDNNDVPIIKIWKSERISHRIVAILEGCPMRHEGHFGVYLKDDLKKGPALEVCSVEHAEAIIKALKIAIERQMVLPKDVIKNHKTSSTTTRARLEENIREGITVKDEADNE